MRLHRSPPGKERARHALAGNMLAAPLFTVGGLRRRWLGGRPCTSARRMSGGARWAAQAMPCHVHAMPVGGLLIMSCTGVAMPVGGLLIMACSCHFMPMGGLLIMTCHAVPCPAMSHAVPCQCQCHAMPCHADPCHVICWRPCCAAWLQHVMLVMGPLQGRALTVCFL